jgi:hypothetical protein
MTAGAELTHKSAIVPEQQKTQSISILITIEKLKQQAVNELTTRDKVEQMLGDYS